MLTDRQFALVARAFAALGVALLVAACGLAVAQRYYGMVMPEALIVAGALVGAGGTCLGALLVGKFLLLHNK